MPITDDVEWTWHSQWLDDTFDVTFFNDKNPLYDTVTSICICSRLRGVAGERGYKPQVFGSSGWNVCVSKKQPRENISGRNNITKAQRGKEKVPVIISTISPLLPTERVMLPSRPRTNLGDLGMRTRRGKNFLCWKLCQDRGRKMGLIGNDYMSFLRKSLSPWG